MTLLALLIFYFTLIVFASLFGGWLPSRIRLTHTRMQLMMSFVAGLMLGVGLLHMLPHALRAADSHAQSYDHCAVWMLAGLLATFFLIRAFHFHHHAPTQDANAHDDHYCELEHDQPGAALRRPPRMRP